jgi:hypothetical protein
VELARRSDRIIAFTEIVGQENVIARTHCRLGGRVHPQIAWVSCATGGDREQEVVELIQKCLCGMIETKNNKLQVEV